MTVSAATVSAAAKRRPRRLVSDGITCGNRGPRDQRGEISARRALNPVNAPAVTGRANPIARPVTASTTILRKVKDGQCSGIGPGCTSHDPTHPAQRLGQGPRHDTIVHTTDVVPPPVPPPDPIARVARGACRTRCRVRWWWRRRHWPRRWRRWRNARLHDRGAEHRAWSLGRERYRDGHRYSHRHVHGPSLAAGDRSTVGRHGAVQRSVGGRRSDDIDADHHRDGNGVRGYDAHHDRRERRRSRESVPDDSTRR